MARARRGIMPLEPTPGTWPSLISLALAVHDADALRAATSWRRTIGYGCVVSELGDVTGVRRAELVAALSMASDLALGQPMEHVLRLSRIALRLAAVANVSDDDRAAAFYVGLLAWVGCVATSHDLADVFGDDIRARADSALVDRKMSREMLGFMFSHAGSGRSPWGRVTSIGRIVARRRDFVTGAVMEHCEATADFASQLGLGPEGVGPLRQTFERWDGKGTPGTAAREAVAMPVRLVQVATTVEVFHRVVGRDGAVAEVRRRRATQFDPDLVDCLCDEIDEVLEGLDATTCWDDVIALAPNLGASLSEDELDQGLDAFADFADVKSPFTLGHSRGVAALGAAAAADIGMSRDDVTLVRRAGLVHDIGAVGVSNAVWESNAPLAIADRERIRAHPYLTERTLARPEALGRIGALGGLHHERLDGSGYPHALSGENIPIGARVLAVADAYHAMTEPRPHRAALSASDVAAVIRAEVREGRLDGAAADAVLGRSGHLPRRRAQLPGGLTGREVEVLRLVARGFKTRDIARRLGIADKTVSAHIDHIYTKLGVSTRTAAALFGLRHGLIPAAEERPEV